MGDKDILEMQKKILTLCQAILEINNNGLVR